MELASIGVLDRPEALKRKIGRAFTDLGKGSLDVQEERHGSLCFLHVHANVPSQQRNDARQRLASALAEHIIDKVEPGLLGRLIGQNYGYFDTGDRKEILKFAGKNLSQGSGRGKTEHKKRIAERLLDYLETSRLVNLEGFITFRLKDYMGDLEDAVDRAIDDFLLDREYREFIRLLRYFVEVQKPRLSEVNVVFYADGRFDVLDQDGSRVANDETEDFVIEMVDAEIAYEDLLVSTLITLAPHRVVLHDAPHADPESVETVRSVFVGRVVSCGPNCGLCLSREK